MINKTSGSHHDVFDLMRFQARCTLQYSSERMNMCVDAVFVIFVAPPHSSSRHTGAPALSAGSTGHAGSCARTRWICMCLCVMRWTCGECRPRAAHVKFMFCAAFHKGYTPTPHPAHPRNSFCGEGDFPRRRQEQAQDNEAEKKGNRVGQRYTGASEMNESLRRGNGEKVWIILLDGQKGSVKPN